MPYFTQLIRIDMSTKHTHYIPHPANLRHDIRMKRAMRDLPGCVGYGVIVLLIEHLRCEPGYSFPMKDIDILADEFKISLPILQTVITSYGFFQIKKDENQELLISPLLNDLMAPYLEKKEKNRIAGKMSAKKRKIKQEHQLKLLSELDSSQHVLNTTSTHAQQNREEYNREEYNKVKKILSIDNFSIFKKLIIKNYKNRVVCYGPENYLDTTPIYVTELGYLKNGVNNQDFEKEEAVKIWVWMYRNQKKLNHYPT